MKNKNNSFKIFVILFLVANSILGHSQQFGNGVGVTLRNYDLNSNPNLASGYYSVNYPTNGPSASNWEHFITYKHPHNNGYALQFNAAYHQTGKMFFRLVNGGTYGAWNEIATRGANTFSGNQIVNGKIAIGTTETSYGNIRINSNGKDDGICFFANSSISKSTFRMYLKGENGYITRAGDDSKGIVIANSGNVGIGKNPTAKFEVNGTGKFNRVQSPFAVIDEIQLLRNKSIGLLASNSYSYSETHSGQTRTVNIENYSLGWYNVHPSGPIAILSSWMAIQFHTQYQKRMEIRNGGIVQIFTKLEVPDIEVKNLALPDYVFMDDYDLKSINEVEQFIKSNGHLPDVPSASHVAENGMNVTDMTNVMLKKIEELTLYIIEQNKRIEQLEKISSSSEEK